MKYAILLAMLMGTLGCGKKPEAKHQNVELKPPYYRTQLEGTFPVPRATGEHPDPIWFDHPLWGKYDSGDGFWQCPIGYVQYQDEFGAMGPSKNGEATGGSEAHDKMPKCRLPKKGEFE